MILVRLMLALAAQVVAVAGQKSGASERLRARSSSASALRLLLTPPGSSGRSSDALFCCPTTLTPFLAVRRRKPRRAACAAREIGNDAPSQAVQSYYKRRREAMGAWTEERRGRDLCERCRRAREMCLCSSLPAEAMPTSTRFVILQHPAETKKRVTGTVPLILHCLADCTRVVMRYDYSEEDVRKALGVELAIDRSPERVSERSSRRENSASTGTPLLLFPCPGAEYLEDIAASRDQSAPSAQPFPPTPAAAAAAAELATGAGGGEVVVLIDGTWSQAKQILSRYPSLLRPRMATTPAQQKTRELGASAGGVPVATVGGSGEAEGGGGSDERWDGSEQGSGGREAEPTEDGALCRAVKFRCAGVSGYGFRREPAKECLSTLESVAYTLEVLEGTPQGLAAAAFLRKAFKTMVSMQLSRADAGGRRPRFVNRKERTTNRRSTPKKGIL
ncbi:unnamed protein product [Ectocarpus sp. CCAP 1310/34]|nr:unnamed protein product [Ectocarpus sp. CCAP 1310/34]